MNKSLAIVTTLCLLWHVGTAWSFGWDKDMVDQPSAKPQESAAPAQPGSVPVDGGETLPAPANADETYEGKDRAVDVPNPVPATADSIARGEHFYQIHCVVCHGTGGQGDGPVGRKFDTEPADLTDAYVQDQADGQIFYTLTRGRDAMPYYRDALSQDERWDIVNYIRHVLSSP